MMFARKCRGVERQTGSAVKARASSPFLVFVVVCVLVLSGCVRITGVGGGTLELQRTEDGLSGVELTEYVAENLLIAKVKGSIYESGETVSVFGTCLDADDNVIPNVTAELSAWYPNGTQFINASNMTEVQPSYFLYTAPMSPVQGTYLTQLRCELDGQFALAFGEWQNPFWVTRINATQQAVLNVSDQVEILTNQVNASFNVTFTKLDQLNTTINQTFTNISQQITEVGIIANGSVDRNDSLLAQLLFMLKDDLVANEIIVVVESTSPLVFRHDFTVNVTATDSLGNVLDGGSVNCFINTTNNPPTVEELMNPVAGPKFTFTEKVIVVFGYQWDTWCVYT